MMLTYANTRHLLSSLGVLIHNYSFPRPDLPAPVLIHQEILLLGMKKMTFIVRYCSRIYVTAPSYHYCNHYAFLFLFLFTFFFVAIMQHCL